MGHGMSKYSWILLGLVLTGSAQATEPVLGFYAGGGIGDAELSLEDPDSDADFEASDVSLRVLGGYRFNRYFAVEASYADYGNPNDTVLGVDLEGSFTAFGVSAVGLFPLRSVDLDLFGKLGIGAWDGKVRAPAFGVDASDDDADILLGFGVQYRTGKLTLRAEAEGQGLSSLDDDDRDSNEDIVSTLWLSAMWSFR